MTRKWFLLALLAIAFLLASAFWWISASNRWTPPPAQPPMLPELTPLPTPQTDAMRQARARPLLWASRRPPQPAAKAPPEPVVVEEKEQPGELDGTTLEAVLESGGQRIALLRTADGKRIKISLGAQSPDRSEDALSGWRVERFDGTTAVLASAKGERVERTLNPGEPPLPAPAQQRGAPEDAESFNQADPRDATDPRAARQIERDARRAARRRAAQDTARAQQRRRPAANPADLYEYEYDDDIDHELNEEDLDPS